MWTINIKNITTSINLSRRHFRRIWSSVNQPQPTKIILPWKEIFDKNSFMEIELCFGLRSFEVHIALTNNMKRRFFFFFFLRSRPFFSFVIIVQFIWPLLVSFCWWDCRKLAWFIFSYKCNFQIETERPGLFLFQPTWFSLRIIFSFSLRVSPGQGANLWSFWFLFIFLYYSRA